MTDSSYGLIKDMYPASQVKQLMLTAYEKGLKKEKLDIEVMGKKGED